MIGWRRPISRRVWPNSTRPNQATCIGSRQAIAWMSKTLFEAPRRARLQSRQGGREWEPASASPSTQPRGSRPEHQSRHHPPVRAACGGGRGPRTRLCAGRWRGCSTILIGRTLKTSSPPLPPPIPAASDARPSTMSTPLHRDPARGYGGSRGARPDRAAICHGL